jgi:hypothetical protein
MMYYAIDLYELVREHQQQLRNQALQDRLARQAAVGADEPERADEVLSREGALLKARGRATPAPAGNRSPSTCSPGHSHIQLNGARHPH